MAVIAWLATDKVVRVQVAWEEPFKVVVASVLVPSLKVIVPVGVPVVAATVAVNVTDDP